MSKPNTITKKEYPELWELFTEEEDYDLTEKEHRRGASFYVTLYYRIDDELLEYADGGKIPVELYGLWQTDTLTWSDDWGLDNQPDVLYRVEPVITERVIKETHYKRVTDES